MKPKPGSQMLTRYASERVRRGDSRELQLTNRIEIIINIIIN
jgi:hypothetical protein